MLKAALMTPRRAPLGLLKSVAIRVSQEYHAMVKRKGQLTGQPRRDSLQTIENGAIVAAGHLATESSRHEGEVKTTEVGLLVPRCGVELHQPVHLRLAGHFVDVCHDHVDCCVFVFWCVIGGCYLAPAIVPNPGPHGVLILISNVNRSAARHVRPDMVVKMSTGTFTAPPPPKPWAWDVVSGVWVCVALPTPGSEWRQDNGVVQLPL
ncbi:hypothetical protein DL546_004773 [Coniochaeta pulveracea]|uniref:Uncharacterized protein n=1 Tax=Coniochaeta pulveracea TaxID=177199 RepID=A0A420Y605_9PEZI|nr:hypothetical protein DL546_004773 [Coniochaeta pulveracea]